MQFYEKRKLSNMKNAKDELIKKIGKANIVWTKIYYYEEEKAFFDKDEYQRVGHISLDQRGHAERYRYRERRVK